MEFNASPPESCMLSYVINTRARVDQHWRYDWNGLALSLDLWAIPWAGIVYFNNHGWMFLRDYVHIRFRTCIRN
jgi:hypothetical protein